MKNYIAQLIFTSTVNFNPQPLVYRYNAGTIHREIPQIQLIDAYQLIG